MGDAMGGRFPNVGRRIIGIRGGLPSSLTIGTRGLPVWRGLPEKGRLTIGSRGLPVWRGLKV